MAHGKLRAALATERRVAGWGAVGLSQTAWAKYENDECKLESEPAAESRLAPAAYYACDAYLTNLRIEVVKATTGNISSRG